MERPVGPRIRLKRSGQQRWRKAELPAVDEGFDLPLNGVFCKTPWSFHDDAIISVSAPGGLCWPELDDHGYRSTTCW